MGWISTTPNTQGIELPWIPQDFFQWLQLCCTQASLRIFSDHWFVLNCGEHNCGENKQTKNILLEVKIMPSKILLKWNKNWEPNTDSLRKGKWGIEMQICCNLQIVLNLKLPCFSRQKLKLKCRLVFFAMSREWPQISLSQTTTTKISVYAWCGCGLLSKLSFGFPPFASWEEMNLWKWRKWLWMFRGHLGDQSPRCCVSSEIFWALFTTSRSVTRPCRVLSNSIGCKGYE